jgi:hypothetical protein
MWSSMFLASNARMNATPKAIPVFTEQERSNFLNILPKIKSLPLENYIRNRDAVLQHARPKGASLSVSYLQKHKLMGMENGQFLFDTVVKSEYPMATAVKIRGFINHTSLKSNDPEYKTKIQGFINSLSSTVEIELSSPAEKAVLSEPIDTKEADAEQSDDEEKSFVFV